MFLLHDTFLGRELIILVRSLLISVKPVARSGGNTSVRFLTRGASGRTIGLVIEVVEVHLLLVKRAELAIIGLLEDIRLQLLLPHLISIYFPLVLRLRKPCLGIPTGVSRNVVTFLGTIESCQSLLLQSFILMSQHVRGKFIGFSLFAVSEIIVNEGLLGAIMLVGISLVGVPPVGG